MTIFAKDPIFAVQNFGEECTFRLQLVVTVTDGFDSFVSVANP